MAIRLSDSTSIEILMVLNFFQKPDYLLSEDINNEIQDRTVQQAREQGYDGFEGTIGSMERGIVY